MVEPIFTQNNYMVCSYCIYLGRDFYGFDEPVRSCVENNARLENNTGLIERLKMDGIKSLNSDFGCLGFRPSGVPIHPIVLEVLFQRNLFTSQIPVDENATECFTAFERKIDEYNSNVRRRPMFRFF